MELKKSNFEEKKFRQFGPAVWTGSAKHIYTNIHVYIILIVSLLYCLGSVHVVHDGNYYSSLINLMIVSLL